MNIMKTKTTVLNLPARAAMTLLALMLTSLSAWAADQSGRCGTNLWYHYYTSTQALYIYIGDQGSTGYMTNYYPDDDYYQDKAPWKNYRGEIKKVNIGEGVTSIGNCAFYGCTALTEVYIPGTVTDIGNEAFYNCISLTDITIPNSVTRLGTGAFDNCWRLADITMPETMSVIENFAFKGCQALTSLNFPSGVTNISEGVFRESGLTSFTIPEGVTNISQDAFWACESLKSVTIPEGVKGIGIRAFQGCSSLENVDIPGSVTSIGEAAFWGCSSLTDVAIADGVTSIGVAAFKGCSSLESVDIPGTVTSIGEDAFEGCSPLTRVAIPGSVKSIGDNAFLNCSSLTGVDIPGSVTSIGEAAFKGCSSLTDVTIADSVKSIGEYAFRDCSSLTSVAIPSSVTSIGGFAFCGCSSLTDIYCYAATPPAYDKSAFWGNAENRKIYVPTDCVDAYKESWSNYRDVIVGVPVYTITVEVSPDDTFGTATVSTTVAAQGDKVVLTATPKPGYRFVWWDVTGGAVITMPSAEQTTLTMPKKNITLTARFQGTEDNPNTFTLTLDANDDNPIGMAEIHVGIKSCTLPTRTRTGYYFLGWATSPTGEPAYQAGEELILENDLTLYGRWLKTPVELANNAPNAETLSLVNGFGPIDVVLKNRSLVKDGYWNTLCLPFDLELEDSQLAGATLMELDAANTAFDSATGTLHLNFQSADSIQAGIPYLIKWGTPNTDPDAPSDAIFGLAFSGVTFKCVGPKSVSSADGAVAFTGTFAPVAYKDGDRTSLYMGENDTIYYFGPNASLNSFRALFRLGEGYHAGDLQAVGQVKSFVVNFEGEDTVTGIPEITPDGRLNFIRPEEWYDLSGRRISGKPASPGIYINNGRKIVIK